MPYRDSKLTRLLQTFFLGRGVSAMVVNISQTPELFDETLQVLKFSAVAKRVGVWGESMLWVWKKEYVVACGCGKESVVGVGERECCLCLGLRVRILSY